MSQRNITIGETVYLWFGLNNLAGSGSDGTATPTFDVRLGGASAGAAPVLSGNMTLLTHANYPNGCFEAAIVASVGNGFADGSTYGVFSTAAVDSQNPTGFLGDFKIGAVRANVDEINGSTSKLDKFDDLLGAGLVATAQAGTLSTTEMTTNLASAVDDFYNGQTVRWLTGNLAGRAATVSDYDGATKKLVFSAVNTNPQAGDKFALY